MKNKKTSPLLLFTFGTLALLLPLIVQMNKAVAGQLVTDSAASSSSESVSSTPVLLTLEEVQKQVAKKQWTERIERVGNFREEVLQTNKIISTLNEATILNRKKRDTVRAECRLEVRKASVYTLLSAHETCYKNELELELDTLAKEREYIQTMPGISSDIRQLTMTRIDLLSDALSVVINAIDNQVYESVAELEEAKLALLESYRDAKWTMYIRSQADQLLTRTSSIIIRIGTVAENTVSDADMSNSILQSLQCFSDAEALLKTTVSSSSYAEVTARLDASKLALQKCSEDAILASNTYAPPVEKNAIATEASSSDTSNSSSSINAAETSSADATKATAPKIIKNIQEVTSIRISGFDPEKYKKTEVVLEPKAPGEQINGPGVAECDTSTLSRKLLSRIRGNDGDTKCRINE